MLVLKEDLMSTNSKSINTPAVRNSDGAALLPLPHTPSLSLSSCSFVCVTAALLQGCLSFCIVRIRVKTSDYSVLAVCQALSSAVHHNYPTRNWMIPF